MITLAVVNLKGGSGKTTTGAFILHAWHESGLRVAGADADGENQSLASWQELGDWPFPVVSMPKANLADRLTGAISPKDYDAVVIDTPPMQEHRKVVRSAVEVATHVVITMAPTPMEYARLSAIRALVDEEAELRPADPPRLAVLLNRCAPRAASTGVYRQLVTDDGLVVLEAQIPRREIYAQAYGDPIKKALATPYGDAAAELLDLKAVAA